MSTLKYYCVNVMFCNKRQKQEGICSNNVYERVCVRDGSDISSKRSTRIDSQPAAWVVEAGSYLDFSLDFQEPGGLSLMTPETHSVLIIVLQGDTVDAEISNNKNVSFHDFCHVFFILNASLTTSCICCLKTLKALLLPDVLTVGWVVCHMFSLLWV